MKVLAIIALMLTYTESLSQGKVISKIYNIKNNRGVCRACLFNSAQAFDAEAGKPYQCQAVQVQKQTAEITFDNIPAGTYALFVFHDVNDNNKMDKNFMGIPKEGYGASKNKLPFASAPSYNDNKFVVTPKSMVELSIKLRNL
jgi:uncharacterized protein (DUF2141 family)